MGAAEKSEVLSPGGWLWVAAPRGSCLEADYIHIISGSAGFWLSQIGSLPLIHSSPPYI